MTMTHDATGNPAAPWEQSDDDDLEDQLPKRRLSWLSGLLAVLVVGGGAFLGGVQVQKHHDKGLTTVSSSTTGATGRTGASGTGTGTGAGAGTGRGFGAGTTVGQVKLVDGSTIYVTDTSGNTLTVNTTSASTYTKSESVALKDIQPGDTVIIRGPTQSDGTVNAASVTDSGTAGTGALGGFGGRFGRGGSGASGTGGTGTGTTGAGGTGTNG